VTLTGAPPAKAASLAVWTGTEMLLWGGCNPCFSVGIGGGRYDPVNDRWSTVAAGGGNAIGYNQGAGVTPGTYALWTGGELLLSKFYEGSSLGPDLYAPATDSWRTSSLPLVNYAFAWTGTEALGFGTNTSVRYSPGSNQTTAITPQPARLDARVVWTGTEALIFGGASGLYRYDPQTSTMRGCAAPPAATTATHTYWIWTGSHAIAWSTFGASGARYDPVRDSWSPMTIAGAPASRVGPAVVSTGSEMLIWGGKSPYVPTYHRDGMGYLPAADAWVPMLNDSPNTARAVVDPSVVWTGTEMILWGGQYQTAVGTIDITQEGARFRR
jgi:hypothetical protein